MKRKYIFLFLLVLGISLIVFYKLSKMQRLAFLYGSYDPDKKMHSSHKMQISHFFIDWNNVQLPELENTIQQENAQDKIVLLTVEPWPSSCSSEQCDLVSDIKSGRYNSSIDSVCGLGKELSHPLLIRWGHEMDNIGRYPWSGISPEKYIEGYQYMVNRCRKISPNLRFVWSPLGNENSPKYWPGKDYVDYIGLSVFHYPQYELKYWKSSYSFYELFEPKYARLAVYNRPIIIAELGVAGSPEEQKQWLLQAQNDFGKFHLLRGIVYFNSKEQHLWDSELPLPYWTLCADFPGEAMSGFPEYLHSSLYKIKLERFLKAE